VTVRQLRWIKLILMNEVHVSRTLRLLGAQVAGAAETAASHPAPAPAAAAAARALLRICSGTGTGTGTDPAILPAPALKPCPARVNR